MIYLEYLLTLGSFIVISCFIWLSMTSLTMNSPPISTGEPREASKGCSPSRRNRRSRKAKHTLSNTNSSNMQGTSGRNRRALVEIHEDMHVDGTLTPVESMETDMQCQDNENNDAETQNQIENQSVRPREKREHKRRNVNKLQTESDSETQLKKDSSPARPKDFSHPIYKQMSLRNGSVNRMSKVELQNTMQELGLNRLGSADVLKRRLKHHYSRESLKVAGLSSDVPVRFDYLCVIDVEATCQEINPVDYIHEIIEFPIVLLNTKTLQIEDTFDAFCKPVVNPQLSKFCSQLTHISQKMVDKADEFPTVLKKAELWMRQKGLGTKHSFAIAADCSLDMDLYLKLQCLVSEIPYPQYAKEWVNISKVFANLYKTKRVPLRAMLDSIGLAFMGQPHRGIDDARNIARIALQLIEDGAEMKYNERLTPS